MTLRISLGELPSGKSPGLLGSTEGTWSPDMDALEGQEYLELEETEAEGHLEH